MAIKAVIFDCFGVLTTDGWKQIRQEVLTEDAQWDEARRLDQAVNTGRISYNEFVAEVAKLVGRSESETRKRLVTSAPTTKLFEYIRDSLKPHYKIGMLSNAADNWLDELFEPWQVELFDETVLSYQVGMVKPDPNIYDLAATKLGVLPEECVFVDDVERYVVAAVDVGMKGIVFTDTEQFMTEFEEIRK